MRQKSDNVAILTQHHQGSETIIAALIHAFGRWSGNVPRHILAIFVSVFGGCSTHPLTDDVTDLSTHAIVDKVRCEAREKIQSLLDENSFAEGNQRVKLIVASIENIKKLEGKDLELDRTDIKRSESELRARLAENKAERAALTQKTQIVLAKIKNTPTDATGAHIQSARIAATSDQLEKDWLDLERKTKKLDDDILLHNVLDKRYLLARTKFDNSVSREQAKLGDYASVSKFLGHQIALNFRFDITETNNAAVNGSAIWPIPFGTVTLGGGAGEIRERQSIRNVRIAATFGELLDLKVCGAEAAVADRKARRYPIVGKIGLDEVLDQYFEIQKTAKFTNDKEKFTHAIEFSTTINASLTPEITIARVNKYTVGGDLTIGAKRLDIHEVTVLLAPIAPSAEPDKITRVQLVASDEPLLPSTSAGSQATQLGAQP